MNRDGVDYLWSVLAKNFILGADPVASQSSTIYEEGIELPSQIETQLLEFFATSDRRKIEDAALMVARSFALTSYRPEDHLLLVGALLKDSKLSDVEACELAQIDGSNMSLLSESGRNLVRLAEIVSEEARMKLRSIDSDSFFASHLLAFFSASQLGGEIKQDLGI